MNQRWLWLLKLRLRECNITFWNADIVALATGLYINWKCCLDVLSKGDGQCFTRQMEQTFPMVGF